MKIWLTVLLVAVLGAAAWYYFQVYQPGLEAERDSAALVQPKPVISQVRPEPEPEPTAAEPEYDFYQSDEPVDVDETPDLPPLAESDAVINETIAGLIGESAARRTIVTDALVSRFVATVDALSSAQVPAIVLPIEPVVGELEATSDESPEYELRTPEGDLIPQYVLDPDNFRRYGNYVEMLEAVNIDDLVANYRSLYPLFQQAWRQLGYGDDDFNARLLEVIEELLETQQSAEPVRLLKPEAVYTFRNQELEALTAGQKTLIRMGSANAARVKAWLRELRAAIEML